MLSRRNVAILLAGALVLIVVLVILALYPGPTQINTTDHDADIAFRANRRWVVNTGDCVTVSWDVQNIQAVTIDGAGHIGQGEADFCVESLAGLSVTMDLLFVDGATGTYTLQVGLMAKAPEVWILVTTVLVLLVMSGLLLLAPIQNRVSLRGTSILRSAFKWAALTVTAIIATLMVLEIGLRYYFTHHGTPNERAMYVSTAEEIRQNMAEEALPFIGFGLSSTVSNNLGFYGPDVEVPKPNGVFRIVAFGDSTTYGLGTDSSLAYPAQLQQVLREEYGYTNVEVVNAGVPSYTSWNHVASLAFRVLELEPDMILLYFGMFDAQARLVDPECYRGLNSQRGLPPDAGVWYPNLDYIGPSTLYRYIAINLGWMDDPLDTSKQVIILTGCSNPAPEPDVALAENPPVYFERNIRTMVGIARAHGAQALLSTWTDDKTEAPESRPDWLPGVIDEHNEVIRKVASEMDTLFYDLAGSDFPMVSEFWFGDHVHQSVEGHAEQARRYAAYLVEEGVIPSPP